MFKILVVEDDFSTRKYLEVILSANGFEPILTSNAKQAMDKLVKNHIDLVITDLMMPEIDGYQLVEQIRSIEKNLPILVVSAKETSKDKIKGFLVGIDDYMVKPIDDEEMILRVRALLRRAKIASEKKIVIGEIIVNYNTLSVSKGSEVQILPQKEFYLLFKLLSYPDVFFTKMQLLNEIWGYDSQSDEHTVSVHISRLRDRFYNWKEFEIVTIRGLGYKVVYHEEKK